MVLLDARSQDVSNLADLPKKWRPRYLGPLRVHDVMGPVTYRIELPPSMKRAHNMFHDSKLKKYYQKNDEVGLVPITIDADGTQGFEVKLILDIKKEKRRVYFRVQFEGEPEEEAVWLPREN